LGFDEKKQKTQTFFFCPGFEANPGSFLFFHLFSLALLLSCKTLRNSYIYGQGEENSILKCKFTAKGKKIKQNS
jgi:hypothetical protein